MLEVFHHPICPFSRKLRIVLNEKKVEYELILEKFWERRVDFITLNPAGETPLVIYPDNQVISGNYAIFEYLEEINPNNRLLSNDPIGNTTIRRISEWFDNKFYNEVTKYLINEKVIKVITKIGEPNSSAIRAAKKNMIYHIDYIGYLLQNNDYLCGDKITLADFAAASQISVLDFIGDIPWERNKAVKHWYALIKSRPSFRPILQDKIIGFYPPKHYSDPDF